MPKLTSDIDIAAAPENVFEALLDSAGYAEWLTLHDGWPDGPPVIADGGTFREDVNLIGKSAQITWTVLECRNATALAFEGRGPMGFRLQSRYLLAPGSEAGTTLRSESEFDGGPLPLGGRLGGIVTRKVQTSLEESLAGLKAAVEAQGDDRRRPARSTRWSSDLRSRRARGVAARWRTSPRGVANDRLLAAVEENTRAINALREEIARTNEQVARVAWLGGPLDLLRRGAGQKGSEPETDVSTAPGPSE